MVEEIERLRIIEAFVVKMIDEQDSPAESLEYNDEVVKALEIGKVNRERKENKS
jgi:hypothetical protein